MQPIAIDQTMKQAMELHQAGRLEAAAGLYRQALAEQPEHPQALHLLGVIAHQTGQHEAAVEMIRRAIVGSPNASTYHSNLGLALTALGRLDEAIAALQTAVQLRPDHSKAHNNLGNVLMLKGDIDRAVSEYQAAIRLSPNDPEVLNNLANTLKEAGQLDQAIACYRRVLAVNPNDHAAHSNLVYALHFHPAYDARRIHEEYVQWRRRHADPLRQTIRPHENDRNPDRRLRVGYISPDFRTHPVARFLLPLLQNHDHTHFEISCYSDVAVPDSITAQIESLADSWRPIVALSDADVAERVRADRIDVLVDLTMHMARNRMLVFARKPAPVQVTYLAYCSTTGLDTIDYRITDPYLDSVDSDATIYSEKSIHLPQTYWCYPSPTNQPADRLPPSSGEDWISFGCLNNFAKVTPGTISTWCRLLRQVPRSNLIVHTDRGAHRQRLTSLFAAEDIEANRLEFVGSKPMAQYLDIYRQIDIALDPFPYNGGTTTCDALWMGVPVVSLAGRTAVGRAGLTLLSNIGLPELVARSEDEYVRIAAELANDRPRLQGLRMTLRTRMKSSPLMDAPRFARDFETAYRRMWREYCAKREI